MEKSLPTVVFITALPCEFKAITEHLIDLQEETHPKGTVYNAGKYQGKEQKWRVAVAEIGQTNPVAAQETERAIQHFQPIFAFFVGVAGGIKDVGLGDVVAAEVVKGYERGKETDKGFLPRSDVGKSSYDLVQRARATARETDWLSKIKRGNDGKKINALVAKIAAGEQVIASKKTETFNLLKNLYSDVVAVEMEGIGFLTAIEADRTVSGIVIRGISDLLKKTAKHDQEWQQIAAQNAAAFAFTMLDKLKFGDSDKPSSLIFQLQQNNRNSDTYDLQVWIGNYINGKSLKKVCVLENEKKDNLPSKIDDIICDQLIHKRVISCTNELTIEFFLPKELLCEPIDQWIIDQDIQERLGDCYKLIIRSSERFENMKMFRRLKDYWQKNPALLQMRFSEDNLNWIKHDDDREIKTKLEAGKLFFILESLSDQGFIFKIIQHGVPFLLWSRNLNHDECIQDTFRSLLSCCQTLEQLPEMLRKKRLESTNPSPDKLSMTFNISLLWDDPNKIPPFSTFYTAPTP